MSKKSRETEQTKKEKKNWEIPKLEIVSEKNYESQTTTSIYAQYTGGGGTVTHNPSGMYAESVYNDCM